MGIYLGALLPSFVVGSLVTAPQTAVLASLIPRLSPCTRRAPEHKSLRARCSAALLDRYPPSDAERRRPPPSRTSASMGPCADAGTHTRTARNVACELLLDSLASSIAVASANCDPLQQVRCRRGHLIDRGTFQDWLSGANPRWKEFADDIERTGQQPRTNPDGDVRIHI